MSEAKQANRMRRRCLDLGKPFPKPKAHLFFSHQRRLVKGCVATSTKSRLALDESAGMASIVSAFGFGKGLPQCPVQPCEAPRGERERSDREGNRKVPLLVGRSPRISPHSGLCTAQTGRVRLHLQPSSNYTAAVYNDIRRQRLWRSTI